jgi:thiamine-monophosphate kinase
MRKKPEKVSSGFFRIAEKYFFHLMQQSLPSAEYVLLRKIQKALGTFCARASPYEVTLGDDAAVRQGRMDERVVVTTDIAVENVHFSKSYMSMDEIGFRVIAANVSDCAAMAAQPESALVQLVFPKAADHLTEDVMSLYRGIARACRKWKVRIIGGDLAKGGSWIIGITMLGVAPLKGRLLMRKGVQCGDALWLSSFPGRSAAGMAALRKWGRRRLPVRVQALADVHIRPEPRPDLGIILARSTGVHAMMDLSDGISKDCRTLCYENRLGIDLSFDNITPPEDMRMLSEKMGISWQEWALHGGEEYSLLFAAAPEFTPKILPMHFRKSMVRIGTFTSRHQDLILHREGKPAAVPSKSWDHVRS